MTSRIRGYINTPHFHVAAALFFVVFNLLGYAYAGGIGFVWDWGGGVAAVIATLFLVFKSQGYWAWMVVSGALWSFLFFGDGAPLLGWFQISLLIFSLYGAVQWYLVKTRIGFNPRIRTDLVGCIIAGGVFAVSAYAYWPRDGMTTWWALEFFSVFFAVGAITLDAYKYRANWISWTLSNAVGLPLYYHNAYWGVFFTVFIYQAINVWGWIVWTDDQRQPLIEEMEGHPDDRYYSMVPDEPFMFRKGA